MTRPAPVSHFPPPVHRGRVREGAGRAAVQTPSPTLPPCTGGGKEKLPHGAWKIAALLLPLFLLGCNRTHGVSQPAAGPPRSGSGIIRGVVVLEGRAPAPAVIPNQPCHDGAKPFTDETVVADAKGHLKNVVVYLEDAPAAVPSTSLAPVLLDQIDCRYVPHVLALRTGQKLRVRSSDPNLHNVHGLCEQNDSFNFAMVRSGDTRDLSFDQPEIFPVQCDVHPWMKAWVAVFKHPWFAISAADGSFTIRKVPSGSYKLVAWQERYGRLNRNITVEDGKVTTNDFTFDSGLYAQSE